MGLDIRAYRQLKKLDVLFDANGEPVDLATNEPVDDYLKVWENPDFKGRIDGLENNAVYSYEDSEHIFRMGYGSYFYWRETLAKLAGYPIDTHDSWGTKQELHSASAWNGKINEGSPFLELINFSDCEGTIGTVVAAKLLRDFEDFYDRAKNLNNPVFYEKYCEMMNGLRIAADGGALDFH